LKLNRNMGAKEGGQRNNALRRSSKVRKIGTPFVTPHKKRPNNYGGKGPKPQGATIGGLLLSLKNLKFVGKTCPRKWDPSFLIE